MDLQIVAVGRNYAAHAAELGNEVPEYPLFFFKPRSSIIWAGQNIVVPKECQTLHHEVELGVVIGENAKSIAEEQASDYIAGYVLALDMTARDLQNEARVMRAFEFRDARRLDGSLSHAAMSWCRLVHSLTLFSFFEFLNVYSHHCFWKKTRPDLSGFPSFISQKKGMPWSQSKGYDTFCPLGEFIPKDKLSLEDVPKLEIWAKVDGELKQKAKCEMMIHSVPKLLAYLSSICTLEKGDVVLTGTPEGVGPVRGSADTLHSGLVYVRSSRMATITMTPLLLIIVNCCVA